MWYQASEKSTRSATGGVVKGSDMIEIHIFFPWSTKNNHAKQIGS